jgi:hypothetical protein
VALRAHPGQRSEGTDEVLIRAQRRGTLLLPLTGNSGLVRNLHLAYAEAWLACRFIADRYSEARWPVSTPNSTTDGPWTRRAEPPSDSVVAR